MRVAPPPPPPLIITHLIEESNVADSEMLKAVSPHGKNGEIWKDLHCFEEKL